MSNIELNEEFKQALNILENTTRNIFITGKAGTGKSTLLDYFRNNTRKKAVVLAPTGVAAVNVKGETIHSFFRFKPDITVEKIKKIKSPKTSVLYREIETIIIDEISMVRADLLDCVDAFLRLNGKKRKLPFGGVQMVLIGDLYQLPPVIQSKEKEIFNSYYKSCYFFDAKVFDGLQLEFIELQKIYRQKDEKFISILNAIRNNTVDAKSLQVLNQRLAPDFKIDQLDYYIYLTPTNRLAAEINNQQLDKLKTKLQMFQGQIEGDFDQKYLPTDYELKIKEGAQVMLLNNDELGRWVNGTVGRVTEIKDDVITVELPEGRLEDVRPNKWELFHFQFNVHSQRLETEVVGYFIQYPLKLAWAITMHKSQGKTFDKIVVDVSGGIFACGQVYVALSRCRSLEGIVLIKPIEKKHILMDWRIVNFLTKYQYKISEEAAPLEEKLKIIQQAIDEGKSLKITYLKATDEKSQRTIRPLRLGKMTYLDKPFLGIAAYCFERKEERTFRVDRILQIASDETPQLEFSSETSQKIA